MGSVLLRRAEGFELCESVTPGEVKEGFSRVALVCVGIKEPVHDGWQIGESDGGDELTGNTLILIGAAANDDLVAFFPADFDAHKAEVANVMLSARVAAASDVQVDRLLNFEVAIDMIGESDSVSFGVARSVATALVAGAGYGSAQNCPRVKM